MEWTIYRDQRGKVAGALLTTTQGTSCVLKTGTRWQEFLDWNDAQPPDKKLDLSDQPPPPPPVDTDRDAILATLNKADGDISATEFRAVMLRLARRIIARGI